MSQHGRGVPVRIPQRTSPPGIHRALTHGVAENISAVESAECCERRAMTDLRSATHPSKISLFKYEEKCISRTAPPFEGSRKALRQSGWSNRAFSDAL